mmetsp:Transcript_66634/g.216845  ORF Transcript_66634/g.216845 Transcript_66634/m.216845 type:complete len:87 (-) Transcript_66634:134-394(-)
MVFLDRMEKDSRTRRAYGQVCAMRREPEGRDALERELAKQSQFQLRKEGRVGPGSRGIGPVVSVWPSQAATPNFLRKQNWGPLEYY